MSLSDAEILALRTRAIDAYTGDVEWTVIFARLVAARVLEEAAQHIEKTMWPLRDFKVYEHAVGVADAIASTLRERAEEMSQEMTPDIKADISEEGEG